MLVDFADDAIAKLYVTKWAHFPLYTKNFVTYSRRPRKWNTSQWKRHKISSGCHSNLWFFSLCLCVSWLQAHEISFSLDKNSPSESNYKGPHPNAIKKWNTSQWKRHKISSGCHSNLWFFSLCLCVSWLEAHEISFSLDKNSPSESNYKGPHPNAITVSAVESEHLSKIRFRVSRVLTKKTKTDSERRLQGLFAGFRILFLWHL